MGTVDALMCVCVCVWCGLNRPFCLQVNMQRQGLAVQARQLIVTVRPAGVEISPSGVPLTFRVRDSRQVGVGTVPVESQIRDC